MTQERLNGTGRARSAAADAERRPIELRDLVQWLDDEPRIHEDRLAERLGYHRQQMRALILRTRDELVTHGVLVTQQNSPCRTRQESRPGTQPDRYYLNEGQALVLCVLARLRDAATVRRELVDAFMAFRRAGLVVPATPADAPEWRALIVELQEQFAGIARALERHAGAPAGANGGGPRRELQS